MEFLILGPLEIRDGDRALEVRGPKRRALLAMLVLHANEVIRADRLIEELWGESRPANASAALQNHVSRLRKELGSEVLVTKPWGYVLRTQPDAVDLHRFERLVDEARPLAANERKEMLDEALSLWRGPPLADIAGEPALSIDIARLEEMRLAAVEQRIDAELELGRHEALIPELETLVAQQPLRERLRGQLILALYRSNRQAEALETYRETRRVLVEELGIEPSSALRDLERAILRQDPQLASIPTDTQPKTVDPNQPWRWPRSPLVAAGVVLAFLAAGGALAALIATGNGDTAQPTPAAAATATVTPSTTPAEQQSKPKSTARKPPETPESHQTRRRTSTPVRANATAAKPQSTHLKTQTRRKPLVQPKPTATPRPSTGSSTAPTTTPSSQFPTLADRTAWWTAVSQPQLSVKPQGDQVTVNISGDATDGFNASLQTRCKVVGDFDAQVKFDLAQWSGADGIWVSLMASDLGGVNSYRSDSFGEVYGTYVPPSGGTSVHTDDRNGSLRLIRRANKISGLYRAGSNWTTIFDGTGSTAKTALSLAVFNLPDVAPFAGRPATVRFSSFTLAAETDTC